MIEKKYVCDLCGVDASTRMDSARLLFKTFSIKFCDLTDISASDKIICGKCVKELSEAIKGDVAGEVSK